MVLTGTLRSYILKFLGTDKSLWDLIFDVLRSLSTKRTVSEESWILSRTVDHP